MKQHRPGSDVDASKNPSAPAVAPRSPEQDVFDRQGNDAIAQLAASQDAEHAASHLEGQEGGADLDHLFDEELTAEHTIDPNPFSILAAPQPDWDAFVQSCTLAGADVRRKALATVRWDGRWDEMLASLDTGRTADIQSWMEPTSKEDLQAQLNEAQNGDRARRAMDRITALDDPEGRLTEAVVQTLVLGVAQAANANDELGSEGLLTVNSATAAAEALLAMEETEYRRVLLLLESAGASSRDAQQHVLLEAVAARRDQVGEGGDLSELEGFSDSIRGMDRETLVDATSVAKTQRGDEGLQHKFRRGHAAAAVQLIEAERDPIKALAIDRSGGEGRDALDTDAANAQEEMLERHSDEGREAVARKADDIRALTVRYLTSTQCTPEEKQAIRDYVNGQDYDAAAYASGLPKLERALGLSFPGEHAIAMAREAQLTWSTEGLGMDDMASELTAASGEEHAVDAPAELQVENPAFDQEQLDAWRPYVEGVLAGAAQKVADGEDVILQVTHGSGRTHVLTLTNVDERNGRWLIHNTSNGKTAWIEQSAILEGHFNPLGIDQALVAGTVSRS